VYSLLLRIIFRPSRVIASMSDVMKLLFLIEIFRMTLSLISNTCNYTLLKGSVVLPWRRLDGACSWRVCEELPVQFVPVNLCEPELAGWLQCSVPCWSSRAYESQVTARQRHPMQSVPLIAAVSASSLSNDAAFILLLMLMLLAMRYFALCSVVCD